MGPDKSNPSSARSRPRLLKMRRKQSAALQNGNSNKFDFGLNGSSDTSSSWLNLDRNVCSVFGDRNGNARDGDSSANSQSFGKRGLDFGVRFSAGEKSSFGASAMSASDSCYRDCDGLKLDVQKENRGFCFGASRTGSKANQDSRTGDDARGMDKSGPSRNTAKSEGGHSTFSSGESITGQKPSFSEKESSGDVRHPGVDQIRKSGNFEFVSGSDKCETSLDVNSDKHGSYQGSEDFKNLDSLKFVSGKAVDQEKHYWNHSEIDRSGKENAVPDKMCGDGRKDRGRSTFGFSNDDAEVDIGLECTPTYTADDRFSFTNSRKESVGVEIKFQRAHSGGAFVFGACKGSETSQVRGEKPEDCNVSGDHSNTGPDMNSKTRNSSKSGVYLEKDFVYKLSNEMKGLNIARVNGDQTSTCSSSMNASDTFVFGRNKENSGSLKENQPTGKSSDTSHFSENTTKKIGISPPLSSPNGIGVQLTGGFCKVSFNDTCEKDVISFRRKPDDLHSSGVDYNTPNTKFPFPNFTFARGVDETSDNANSKHRRSKRLNKKNGKLRKKTLVQDLFGKCYSSSRDFKHNSESPMSGSPMEFSPYQVSSTGNAPPKGTESGNGSQNVSLVEKYSTIHFESTDDNPTNLKVESLLPTQDGLSAIRGQYKKKYRLKVGSNRNVQGHNANKGDANNGSAGLAIHEACELWRIRGNQSYHAGKLSKAEEFYSTAIDSVPSVNTLGSSTKPLLLCYGNRAATRMSLGRLREAIDDCRKAAALDPGYLKVTLRAGNCHLILGEVDDAIQCYNKCLGSGIDVCLDRRITIEAADGLLKAKKVGECTCKSAQLLQEGTYDAARIALENVAEALSISRYSEKLFRMKGQALCILRMYDEVIELCEETLHIAKRNFVEHSADANCKNSHVNLWRWNLQTKCYYHLGKLDLALNMIEQREVPAVSTSGDANTDTSTALVASVRELLCFKQSGNEAFRAGRFAEAIEHYTAAISKSVDSRPFMAICLCNRAAAYQSTSQLIDAIANCSLAIALDENYKKAISRRATLHEMIRDYKQATCDLQKLISLLEIQSQTKTREQGGSGGASVRDLRKARRHISLMEEKAKKDFPLDFYSILGIKSSDADSDIKKAYRKAALRHHPDKAGQLLVRSDVGDAGTLWKEVGEKIHRDADSLFKVIGEAYAVLSDPSKRSKYDEEEEMRNVSWNSNRNSSSGCPPTSYSSPYGKGNSPGRHTGFGNNRRWHWYDARSSYDGRNSRW